MKRCRLLLPGFTSLLVLTLFSPIRAEEVVKKMPVPGNEAQAKAEKLIKEVYQEAYARRDPADLRALATILFQEGQDTKGDPATRFVLYREASDLAGQAGDVALAFQVIGTMGKQFDVDVADRKATALAAALRSEKPFDNREITETILAAIDEAIAAESYDAAGRLVTLAGEAARKTRSVALISQVEKRGEEVQELKKDQDNLRKAVETLRTKPDDPDANLLLGKVLCFRKGDWNKGLPLLAKGGDAKLKALAAKDLARPRDTEDQVALADGWWQLAMAEKGSAQVHLQQRSGYWYQQALPELKGTARAQAESRIEAAIVVHELRSLEGHRDRINCVAFSGQGLRAISCSDDKTARLWDLDTSKEPTSLAQLLQYYDTANGVTQDPPITHAAFSPEGTRIVLAGKNRAILYDLGASKRLLEFETADLIPSALTLSSDGRRVLIGRDSGIARVYDVDSGRPVRQVNTGGPRFLAASSSLRLGLSTGEDVKRVQLWSMTTGKPLGPFEGEHEDEVKCAAFSPNSRLIVTGSADQTARVWDLDGKLVKVLAGHKGEVLCTAFTPDGKHVLTGSADKTLRLWDVETGVEVRRFVGHTDWVTTLAISPDGRRALSGGPDKILRLWELTK